MIKYNELDKKIFDYLALLPNTPDEDILAGGKEKNEVLRTYLDQPKFDFELKPHYEILKDLKMVNYDRGIKMKQCCKDYLMEQFGDEEVVNEIYAEYVSSIQEKLPELEGALAAENWSALDSLAHAVKGNALATGDTDIANTAISIRNAAKMSEKNAAASLLEKLKTLAGEI